jgi:iron(III) transport system substrate-binding protein
MRKGRAIGAGLLILTLAPSAGAATFDPGLESAARKEGNVVWYTGLIVNQITRPMAAAFEARFPGMHVQYARASNTETTLKLLNEARAHRPQADMVDSTTALTPLLAAGLVAEFRPVEAARYPADAKYPAGYWTSPNIYYYTAAYNTNLVSAAEAPKTYDDLLDPKWKGKMAWTYDLTGGGPPGFIHNILTIKGEEKGMEYLRAFAKQEPVVIPAAQRVVLDKAISGEYPVASVPASAADGVPEP